MLFYAGNITVRMYGGEKWRGKCWTTRLVLPLVKIHALPFNDSNRNMRLLAYPGFNFNGYSLIRKGRESKSRDRQFSNAGGEEGYDFNPAISGIYCSTMAKLLLQKTRWPGGNKERNKPLQINRICIYPASRRFIKRRYLIISTQPRNPRI